MLVVDSSKMSTWMNARLDFDGIYGKMKAGAAPIPIGSGIESEPATTRARW
jgi:hypothetical protein